MEVSITQFRRNIFAFVNQALEGTDIWVTHKGRRVKLSPDKTPGSRLSLITPLEVVNPEFQERDHPSLLAEMTHAWEKDWADL
ncbi:MAG: hypothetical protein ACRD28_01480 [Acidobacteriaceae bacterium]